MEEKNDIASYQKIKTSAPPTRKKDHLDDEVIPLPSPKAIELIRSDDRLLFAQRWWSRRYFLLAFFCMFVDVFLLFVYASALAHAGPNINLLQLTFVYGIPALALNYYTIAVMFNTTIIEVTQEHISIQHGPLPWFGNKELPSPQIKQIYCKQKVRAARTAGTVSISYTYDVYASLKEGRVVKLLKDLYTPEDALFLERETEAYLGIKDRPVPGELKL